MKKTKKHLAILLGTAVAVTAILFLDRILPNFSTSLLSFPFVQIKTLLSGLAGTGNVGNGVALTLLTGCIFAPMILMLFHNEIRGERLSCIAAIVLTFVLGFGYYMLWNIDRFFPYSNDLFQGLEDMRISSVETMMWSGIIGFLTALGIKRFQKSSSETLIGYGCAALSVVGGVILAPACGSILNAAADIVEKNQDTSAWIISLVCALLELIPALFSTFAVSAAVKTLNLYAENDMNSVLSLAGETKRRCINALLSTVCVSLSCNLITLLFSRYINNTKTIVRIPLLEIAVVLAVLLAARLIEKNKQLSDDNDLFI